MKMMFSFRTSKDRQHPPCEHRSEPHPTRCESCASATSARRKYRWTLIGCLIWPYALQALDSTIVATALPSIVRDFNSVSQQNWIASSFNIAAAAFIPFWAQIADVLGRSVAITAATLLMVVGSALCTGAPTNAYGLLLLGRALQGVAASGLSVLCRIILADGVSLQENAKSWAIFAAVGGFAYGLGPVIGGFLSQVSWRWCFAINWPVGVLALLLIILVLRKHLMGPRPIPELDETAETGRQSKMITRLKTIDVVGQALFILGAGLLILGLTWSGTTYPWKSAAVITPLVAGAVLMLAFALWELRFEHDVFLFKGMRRQRPMISWKLLSARDMLLLVYEGFATGISMFSILYFCDIYFTVISGDQPDRAGLQLLCFVPGIGVGVYMSALLSNKWPRMTFPPMILGTTLQSVAMGLLTWALHIGDLPKIYGFMAMAGAGMGLKFSVSPLHGVGLFREHRASVIALIGISLPFGGAFGLTIMSTVFNNTSGLDAHSSNFRGLSGDKLERVKNGIVWAYVAILPFLGLSLIACCFLGNVILGNSKGPENESDDIVIRTPYLGQVLRGHFGKEPTEMASETKTPSLE